MNQENNDSKKCPICGRPTHKESKYCIFHASSEEKTVKEFKSALYKYTNKINKEHGDYDFAKFIFIGSINFKEDLNIVFFKKTDFKESIFEGVAIFSGVTFDKNVDFGNIIFHRDADFRDVTFYGEVSFKESIFKGDAIFSSGVAIFSGVTFNKNVDFGNIIFHRDADFRDVTFYGEVSFKESIFKGDAIFRGSTFVNIADFSKTTFKRGVDFRKSIFRKYSSFSESAFEGDAIFREVTLMEYVSFGGSIFNGVVDFRIKSLLKGVDFTKIRMVFGKRLMIKITNDIKLISFESACLENIYVDIELNKGILIDFTDALIKNTKIKKNQIKYRILQEKKKNYNEAKEIYILLKNNFHSIGQYEDESWAFKKEKDMEKFSNSFDAFLNRYKKKSQYNKILLNIKKSLVKRIIVKFWLRKKWLFSKKATKWFNLAFSNFIYQYGENPWRVIRFATVVILIFAVLLYISGIVSGDRTDLILKQIEGMQGSNVLKYSGPVIGSLFNCLYFSVVTFTTLGYGDFQPLEGWSRFLVSSEALLGAFTMALFVYTFARRTGGR